MGLFGFKSKKDEVLSHWIGFVDNLQLSPLEFYTAFEKELEAHKIPSMEMSRVEHAEGGVLSGDRIYLRMIRERLAFETCAAPFGTGFFFSCRGVHIPAELKLWHVLVVLWVLSAIYYGLFKLLGTALACIALVALILAIVQVFRTAVASGLSDLDRTLLKTPAIGPIYEAWFRKDTYYRQDTRLVYLEVVPKLFKELAEEAVAAKGVKLTDEYERAPVLGELYKRPTRTQDPK